jgi:phosphoserine phosphatase
MKYELVVFDLDGTLIKSSVHFWRALHKELKIPKNESDFWKKKYYNKEISYREWAKQDTKLFKKHKAKKSDFEKIAAKQKLCKGAIAVLEELKNKGYKMAIISGSLNVVLKKLIPDYKKYFCDVLINQMRFKKNGEIHSVKATRFDFENKALGLKMIAEHRKVPLSKVVFVGNGKNDVAALKKAGLGITVNPEDSTVKKAADITIKNHDLKQILKHL